MHVEIIIAVVSFFTSIVSGYFVYRASTKATSVEGRKVDQEAFDRAVTFYQRQLDDATKQLDRITTQADRLGMQLEKVMTQLASEQDVSNLLRNQVRSLQLQVEVLSTTLADFRARIGEKVDT